MGAQSESKNHQSQTHFFSFHNRYIDIMKVRNIYFLSSGAIMLPSGYDYFWRLDGIAKIFGDSCSRFYNASLLF